MDSVNTLIRAIHQDPGDEMVRLALADLLEDQGSFRHAELLRLHVRLRLNSFDVAAPQEFRRICQLLEEGVRPVAPRIVNSLGMEFVLIPAGRFLMGSPAEEQSRFDDEAPVHEVEISRPFYLGSFLVTQEEYRLVVPEAEPDHFSSFGEGREAVLNLDTNRHPRDSVSWDMAEAFCRRVSSLAEEKDAGRRYRLPSEAEWEYACRAGLSGYGPFHQGQTLEGHQTNFDGREPYGLELPGAYLGRTTPVDAFPSNAFGLYDLHGNLSEWCSDWFGDRYYEESPVRDPRGPDSGEYRVLRGGSWTDPGRYCRAAFRYDRPPTEARKDFGLRVLLEYRA
ncbi:MAG: SUMF1/EgtB/PvdO family nonheme iron enzyme [Gemmataceae bacterium]